jgi:hypothetical protein
MLLSVLGSNISSVLTPLQIYTFSVASTIGIPYIIAFGMLIKEFGFKKSCTFDRRINNLWLVSSQLSLENSFNDNLKGRNILL